MSVSGLVAAVNTLIERIGAAVPAGSVDDQVIDEMRRDADITLADLRVGFRDMTSRRTTGGPRRASGRP